MNKNIWIKEEKHSGFKMYGERNTYYVRQYFLLDMMWCAEIEYEDCGKKEHFRIPSLFPNAAKAKKVCKLIEQ